MEGPLEQLIQSEISNLRKDCDELHPEVIALLNKFNPTKQKRTSPQVEENESSPKRIRLDKYNAGTTDIPTLQAMHSYLDHQLVTLNGNLNKTIANQWAINNDYLANTLNITQDSINTQTMHLQQLNRLLDRKRT